VRIWRRYRAAALLVLTVGLLAALGVAVAWFFDPERPLRALEARLERGESVVLIGETGAPAWSRLLLGDEKTRAGPGADGCFAIHSWDVALLELVRDPRMERFQLRAWVRHEKSDFGEVGLYVCRSEARDGDRRACGFIQIAFNDVQEEKLDGKKVNLPPEVEALLPKSELNRVRLIPRVWSRSGAERPFDDRGSGPTPELFKPAGFAGGDWRRLTLRVRPGSVQGFWGPDDVVVGEILTTRTPEIRNPNRPAVLEPLVEKVLPMPVRGGVGLYILKASASFKSVEIEPLPE
jgi:serine/threonine-protein kinase